MSNKRQQKKNRNKFLSFEKEFKKARNSYQYRFDTRLKPIFIDYLDLITPLVGIDYREKCQEYYKKIKNIIKQPNRRK